MSIPQAVRARARELHDVFSRLTQQEADALKASQQKEAAASGGT
jgi:hypothetical protein